MEVKTGVTFLKNIKNLPPLGTVRNIDASKYDEGRAYATIDFHEIGNFEPHVYKTVNYGKTWTKITSGIDAGKLELLPDDQRRPGKKGVAISGNRKQTVCFI